MDTLRRFFRAPKQSFFLFGPRGTGKSTWLREQYPDALWFDLLNDDLQRQLAGRPERLRELMAAAPPHDVVVIDEVQRVPEILNVVHWRIERRPRPQFVVTGSSARKLRRGAANLLAGRLLDCRMHPFMAGELGDAFDLHRALTLGMLPVVLDASDPEGTLKAYAGRYVREEVLAEALVRSAGQFHRFLEALALSHGAVLNASAVAREAEVDRRTVERFIDIAEDLLICFRLPVFRRRAKRRMAQHPKFYYVDPGLYRTLRPVGPVDTPGELGGAGLEGLVAQHLRAWVDYGERNARLHYWRTREGNEVDFVLYGEGLFWAIEVKTGRDVRPKDLRGLRAFRADYPEARPCLLFMGDRPMQIDGIPCVPCVDFLRELVPGRVPRALDA